MSIKKEFLIRKEKLIEYRGAGGTVMFPENVYQVATGAFNYAGGAITELVFPTSMTEIPDGVCYCLGSLKTVSIPEGVTRIGSNAFSDCSELTEVALPDSVTAIGHHAFSGCKNLKSIRLSDNLQMIEENAFLNCDNLLAIQLPESMIDIGTGAFSGCRSLVSVRIPGSVTTLHSSAFAGCEKLQSVSLPENLKSIENTCFGACKKLEDISIPNSITSIGDRAFAGCESLKRVLLPAALSKIGAEAFIRCSDSLEILCDGKIFDMLVNETKDKLAKLWLSANPDFEADQISAIKKYVGRIKNRMITELKGDDGGALSKLLSCGKVTPDKIEMYIQKFNDRKHPQMLSVLLNYQNAHVSSKKKEKASEKALELTENDTEDWAKVFRWNDDNGSITITKSKSILSEIAIPDEIGGMPVVKIGKNAFKGNSQLQKITIPNTVTEIEESAFEKCSKLSTVVWSENLIVIGKRAFYCCESMQPVLELPQNLKLLGVSAFAGCKFTEIRLPEGLEAIESNSLDFSYVAEIHIPASVKKIKHMSLGEFGEHHGDIYFHGAETEFEVDDFYRNSATVHASADSYAAKCAEKGMLDNFAIIEDHDL